MKDEIALKRDSVERKYKKKCIESLKRDNKIKWPKKINTGGQLTIVKEK